MSGVFAYSGAQLFVEIMAEMRRPWDFIKAMWTAQFFIYAVYLIYGCYVYHYQGQYSFTISYMGLSVYGFQAACDMLVVISGLIAAGLYGNIGIKVLYNQVLMELFGAPPLSTLTGKYVCAAIVPIYWSIAFVVAAAIPVSFEVPFPLNKSHVSEVTLFPLFFFLGLFRLRLRHRRLLHRPILLLLPTHPAPRLHFTKEFHGRGIWLRRDHGPYHRRSRKSSHSSVEGLLGG